MLMKVIGACIRSLQLLEVKEKVEWGLKNVDTLLAQYHQRARWVRQKILVYLSHSCFENCELADNVWVCAHRTVWPLVVHWSEGYWLEKNWHSPNQYAPVYLFPILVRICWLKGVGENGLLMTFLSHPTVENAQGKAQTKTHQNL